MEQSDILQSGYPDKGVNGYPDKGSNDYPDIKRGPLWVSFCYLKFLAEAWPRSGYKPVEPYVINVDFGIFLEHEVYG